MKHIKKLFGILIIVVTSCSIGEESIEINQTDQFYERVNFIITNPSSYASVIPEKVNPFDITLDLKSLNATKGSKVQESEAQKGQVPEEIKNANQSFKDFSLRLIKESKDLSHESFQKLAYAIELEVLESKLISVEKEFILKELAVLKIYSDIKYQKLNVENGRIACDSQFECDLLACAERKVNETFESAETWFEIALATYELAAGGMAYIWANCTYLVLTWN